MAIVHKALSFGESSFIHTGAGSQVGQMVARLAPQYNLDVIHVVRSQSSMDVLNQLQAQYVVNSSHDD